MRFANALSPRFTGAASRLFPLLMQILHRGATARLPLQGLTLLIVDDSRFACDALRLILQRSGARLRRAESLEVARLHLGCYVPDLAIVDLGLPDGRGEVLIAELAQQGLPVLGLSGDPRQPRVRA